jgi:Cu/Ag efflux pump CusA
MENAELFRRLAAGDHARGGFGLPRRALKLPIWEVNFCPHFAKDILCSKSKPSKHIIPEMLRIGREISKELMGNKNIATVEQQVGRAEQGEDPFGTHRCEFHVELKAGVPGEEQESLMKEIGEILDAFPGIQGEVVTFLGDRISETITGSGPVVISVYGPDQMSSMTKQRKLRRCSGA